MLHYISDGRGLTAEGSGIPIVRLIFPPPLVLVRPVEAGPLIFSRPLNFRFGQSGLEQRIAIARRPCSVVPRWFFACEAGPVFHLMGGIVGDTDNNNNNNNNSTNTS